MSGMTVGVASASAAASGTFSLDEILAERERRAAVRRSAILGLGLGSEVMPGVLVQLSPVAPASLRTRADFLSAFEEGERRFEAAVEAMGWNLARIVSARTALGPWTLWALRSSAATPERVKYLCVTLEEESSRGRLWDFDVEGLSGPVGREELGLPERNCVVCGGSAAACSGRRVHPAEAVAVAFAEILRRTGTVPEAIASR